MNSWRFRRSQPAKQVAGAFRASLVLCTDSGPDALNANAASRCTFFRGAKDDNQRAMAERPPRSAVDAIRPRFLTGENGLSQSFHPVLRRCDEKTNPQSDRRPMNKCLALVASENSEIG